MGVNSKSLIRTLKSGLSGAFKEASEADIYKYAKQLESGMSTGLKKELAQDGGSLSRILKEDVGNVSIGEYVDGALSKGWASSESAFSDAKSYFRELRREDVTARMGSEKYAKFKEAAVARNNEYYGAGGKSATLKAEYTAGQVAEQKSAEQGKELAKQFRDTHKPGLFGKKYSDEEIRAASREVARNGGGGYNEVLGELKAGGTSKNKSLDSMMFRKKAGASKGEAHMYDATNKQLAADLNAMSDPLARKDMGAAYGIKDHEKMTTTQFKNAVRDHHAKRINAGPKTMDHIMGHKVPQKAAGLLVTAGVVNALSGSKGQQSNAQLYGQAPMPGM